MIFMFQTGSPRQIAQGFEAVSKFLQAHDVTEVDGLMVNAIVWRNSERLQVRKPDGFITTVDVVEDLDGNWIAVADGEVADRPDDLPDNPWLTLLDLDD